MDALKNLAPKRARAAADCSEVRSPTAHCAAIFHAGNFGDMSGQMKGYIPVVPRLRPQTTTHALRRVGERFRHKVPREVDAIALAQQFRLRALSGEPARRNGKQTGRDRWWKHRPIGQLKVHEECLADIVDGTTRPWKGHRRVPLCRDSQGHPRASRDRGRVIRLAARTNPYRSLPFSTRS